MTGDGDKGDKELELGPPPANVESKAFEVNMIQSDKGQETGCQTQALFLRIFQVLWQFK